MTVAGAVVDSTGNVISAGYFIVMLILARVTHNGWHERYIKAHGLGRLN